MGLVDGFIDGSDDNIVGDNDGESLSVLDGAEEFDGLLESDGETEMLGT